MKKGASPAGISEKVIRLLEVYTLIAQSKFPSIDSMMERFQVARRTVFRYLELINIIDPIEYDRDRGGYKFTNGDRIKKPMLSDEEFQTLLAAGESISHLGKPFTLNFQSLVTRMFTPGAKISPGEGSPIVIKTPDTIFNEKMEAILRILLISVQEKRSVDITYKARLSKEKTGRTVDPYVVVLYEGIWILVGFCHLRKGIRSFALDRIIDIEERNLYFTHRPDFDLKAYLSGPWGIIDGKMAKVTVRFEKVVSDYILRKDKWHPSEKRTILPNGDAELSFTVSGVDEIRRWIYSWLPNVEVTKPKWLRKQIEEELSRSARKHS